MTVFRRHASGIGLRSVLIVLVLVPALGMTGFAAALVEQKIAAADAARDVDTLVRDAAALADARTAVAAETLPDLALAVVQSPLVRPLLRQQGLNPDAAGINPRAVAAFRRRTDAALDHLGSRPGLAGRARVLRSRLAAARQEASTVFTLSKAFGAMEAVVAGLASDEARSVADARSTGTSGALTRSLTDLVNVLGLAERAGQLMPLLASVEAPFLSQLDANANQTLFLDAWAGYTASADLVSGASSRPVREGWAALERTPRSQVLDRTVRRAVSGGLATGVPLAKALPTLITVYQLGAWHDAQLDRLVEIAAQSATGAASAQRGDAEQGEVIILVLTVGLLLLSFLVARVVRRAMAVPLERLASDANRISEGELVDVNPAGPREVRTVAVGLAAAVDNLRNVAAQAEAVAAGDLDSELVRSPLAGRLGAVMHESVDALIRAINERNAAQSDLAHRATHDALTELPNRAQALVLIERSLQRARRTSSLTGLMFVDLDFFKTVNDNLGHAAGDVVLQTVARRMAAIVRDGDTVARLGGDEFVILLEDVDSQVNFLRLAERVVAAVAEPIDVGGRIAHVGASIGIAMSQDAGVDADRLLAEADAAAYGAKESGRGRVGIFDDTLREAMTARNELENALKHALANDELVLHYQPVVELTSGHPIGVEALVRWERPGHGVQMPDSFIPIAESSMLINEIGAWVLREATAQLARWDREDAGRGDLSVAVNISGRHLGSRQLVGDVTDALAASGIAPSRLTVEITETVLVDDPTATENMTRLRELGVVVAIDDFGTGYTSIGQLPRLPIDVIKIDRSFVSSADVPHGDLVRLIVAAAHAFGLRVVAEGIESAGQADLLTMFEVDSGQGFFYARPVPANSAFELAHHERLPAVAGRHRPTGGPRSGVVRHEAGEPAGAEPSGA